MAFAAGKTIAQGTKVPAEMVPSSECDQETGLERARRSGFVKELPFEGDYLVVRDMLVRKIRRTGTSAHRRGPSSRRAARFVNKGFPPNAESLIRIAVSGEVELP